SSTENISEIVREYKQQMLAASQQSDLETEHGQCRIGRRQKEESHSHNQLSMMSRKYPSGPLDNGHRTRLSIFCSNFDNGRAKSVSVLNTTSRSGQHESKLAPEEQPRPFGFLD